MATEFTDRFRERINHIRQLKMLVEQTIGTERSEPSYPSCCDVLVTETLYTSNFRRRVRNGIKYSWLISESISSLGMKNLVTLALRFDASGGPKSNVLHSVIIW